MTDRQCEFRFGDQRCVGIFAGSDKAPFGLDARGNVLEDPNNAEHLSRWADVALPARLDPAQFTRGTNDPRLKLEFFASLERPFDRARYHFTVGWMVK